ncbi:hypothetical protein [Chlorobium ferrooxidans]|uniref:Uncharacterized protein n=1 Tax=Chlorobium ferrooxidans DSM 13031 TaxID=377431 RepID=Q0YTJ0_9CHLB|nr:hypothetical protein [Chlorobium ferrooxidans]EAT59563.1 hypothetical protein CferDRAFT_1570 [Chlorobium ferrooxidans DSM 13031]
MLTKVQKNETPGFKKERIAVLHLLKTLALIIMPLLVESVLATPAVAAPASIVSGTSVFTMTSAPIVLSNIKPATELGLGNTTAYATAQVQLDWINPAAESTLSAGNTYASQQPQTRTINPLWTWAFRLNNTTVPSVSVTYTVTGANGQPGVFSNSLDPSSTIAVTVIPNGVTATKRSSNRWTLTDSVNISFNFGSIKNSGTYSGTVKANITAVNFQ